MLKPIFTFCTIFIAFVAYGQNQLKGKVFEYHTHVALTDVQVFDIINKQVVITDDNGKFMIKAQTGDLLVFSGFSYEPDTLLVTDMRQKEVFLKPREHLLADVNVNSTVGPSTFKFYDPQFHGQTMVYQRDENMNYKGGVIFRIWYWKKDEKERARREKLLADEKMREKIAVAFNSAIIGKYVPLKGKELDDFVTLYTPDIAVFTDNDFNLLNYVNNCYREFTKLPADKRQFKLNSLN